MPTYFVNTQFKNSPPQDQPNAPGYYNTDILNKRNELDTRLTSLYKKRKMIEETQQKDINANVYANIMLTVLGTCLLYFSFVKIVK